MNMLTFAFGVRYRRPATLAAFRYWSSVWPVPRRKARIRYSWYR